MSNLGKAEQVRHHGFSAPVFVGTVGVQAIAAASGFQIDQRDRQVVAAEKPREYPRGFGFPFDIVIGAPRGEAGRDGRRGLQRLLVERLRRLAPVAKSRRANRAELALGRGLPGHKPTQRLQTGIDIARCLAGDAGHDQRLRQSGVVIGEPVLEPNPVVGCDGIKNRDQSIGKQGTEADRADIVRNGRAISIKPEQNKGPRPRRAKAFYRQASLQKTAMRPMIAATDWRR